MSYIARNEKSDNLFEDRATTGDFFAPRRVPYTQQ
jgi:hypothetical protein